MPARVRLLLASPCLLIAPLVVMAGEFPGDTNTITSLTVEQAKQLVESCPGVVVHLSWRGYPYACDNGLRADASEFRRNRVGHGGKPTPIDVVTTP